LKAEILLRAFPRAKTRNLRTFIPDFFSGLLPWKPRRLRERVRRFWTFQWGLPRHVQLCFHFVSKLALTCF
jgi:hypothetical protein